MKKVVTILTVAMLVVITGCASNPPTTQKSSLEIQAIQAKMFETDKSTAFKSVLSVLQDLGYVVQTASLETGVIVAQSPTKQDTSGAAIFAQALGGVRTEGRTYVTATVEDFSAKQTRVRLNFVDRRVRSGAYGQSATDETPILDGKIYSNAFEKIGEAVFIRAAQK